MTISTRNKGLPAGLVFTFLFFMQALASFSQDVTGDSAKIRLIQDEKVDLLVSKHVQINQNLRGIDGYRIQIFFDSGNNSKTKARSIYESFLGKFPGVGAYLTFKAPNYKVRVGDFRSKMDAQRFLNMIIAEYPNAWIIEDQINLPKVEQ
jgi:hypothetical protein